MVPPMTWVTFKSGWTTTLEGLGLTEAPEGMSLEDLPATSVDSSFSMWASAGGEGDPQDVHGTIYLALDVVVRHAVQVTPHDRAGSVDTLVSTTESVIAKLCNPDNYPSGTRIVELRGFDHTNIDDVSAENLFAEIRFTVEYGVNLT